MRIPGLQFSQHKYMYAGHEIFHFNLGKPCLHRAHFAHRDIAMMEQVWVSCFQRTEIEGQVSPDFGHILFMSYLWRWVLLFITILLAYLLCHVCYHEFIHGSLNETFIRNYKVINNNISL